MTFIKREELPVALRAAYDKAAKGVKDDSTRPIKGHSSNLWKNDEKKIDSEKELYFFMNEVEFMAEKNMVKKEDYEKIWESARSLLEKLGNTKKKIEQRIKEVTCTIDTREIARQRVKKYQKEHSNKVWLHEVLHTLSLGLIEVDSEYENLKRDENGWHSINTAVNTFDVMKIINEECSNLW